MTSPVPSSSAISAKAAGCSPNSAARSCSSVALACSSARSYAASSRIIDRISGMSFTVADLIMGRSCLIPARPGTGSWGGLGDPRHHNARPTNPTLADASQ
ncbi:hypothetical protein QFZ55_007733 [Streptomyces luteogriseus]|nr:hypothetical protein [Streptomyces luteogriseus]